MSIIYDALQKTQRNREYLKFQNDLTEKKSYRRLFKTLIVVIFILLGSLGAAVGAYTYFKQVKVPLKSQPHVTQPAQAAEPRSLESEHLWVTMAPQNTGPRVEAAIQEKSRLTLNGVLITGLDKIALINNQSFRMGDIVDGMKIIGIEFNRVKLQNGQNIVELRT